MGRSIAGYPGIYRRKVTVGKRRHNFGTERFFSKIHESKRIKFYYKEYVPFLSVEPSDPAAKMVNRLNAEFTRTPEHRNAILIFKGNHVAAASQ